MKKLIMFLMIISVSLGILAQAPERMSYQAVIRDAGNNLVTGHVVGMRISILPHSPTANPVYTETQTPTTNANGLVTIEIGSGTIVTGTFAGIDWSTNIYFIKTETDPAGGTNYSITGISQLFSVPYALHAKSVTGAVNANNSIISNVSMPINNTDAANKAYVDNSAAHAIGDSYGGGIVFYVYDNGRHGLIAAITDQSTGIRWEAGTLSNTMALADGVGAGKANTAIIIANQGYGNGSTYAARICNEYQVTVGGVTYGDWYLPSKFELNLLYLQKTVVGGFADNGYYWSSTESSSGGAWVQSFATGYQEYLSKSPTYYVRAVRAF